MGRTIGYIILGILGIMVAWWAVKFVFGLLIGVLGALLSVAIPLAVVGGIGYLIYRAVSGKKSLGSDHRSSLP